MKNIVKASLFLIAIVFLTFNITGDATKGVIVSSEKIPVQINDTGTAEVQMLLSKEQTNDPNLYLGRARFFPGGKVPEHVHETSAEMVYVLAGSGEFSMEGSTQEVHAGDAIHIPASTPHSFTNTGKDVVEVIQVYSPAGPEERFKNWKVHTQ